MKKLCISLLVLVMTTLIGPCFQCVAMDMGMPTANAMVLLNTGNPTDCATSMKKNSHSEMKDCMNSSSSHHKMNLESNIINPNLGDFHKFKSLHFPYSIAELDFHNLNPAIKQIVTRGPSSFSIIKKIPPSLPGIIVKKE